MSITRTMARRAPFNAPPGAARPLVAAARLPLTAAGALLLGLTAPIGGAGSLAAQEPIFVGQSAELYVNLTLVDGRGGAPQPDAAILVQGREIRAVGTQSQIPVPEGTQVIDLEGAFVVPGFIDAHAMPRDSASLAESLASGVTGVREAAMPLARFEERGRSAPGDGPGPTLFVGGPTIDAGTGATGLPVEGEESASDAVTTVVEELGAPFVSISPAVPIEWLAVIARRARELDTPVWMEGRVRGWVRALRLGVDFASGLLSGDPALLPEAARADYEEALDSAGEDAALPAWLAALDPNAPSVEVAVTALLSRDAAVVPLLSAAEARTGSAALEGAWPAVSGLIAGLREDGVRMLVGSGASHSAGDRFHREMELLARAGVPPLDILSMATSDGAIALGQLHERGTIEPRKRADFVVLEADPTTDIRNARRIRFVMLDGEAWRVLPEGGFERIRFR